jgi:hypothetical protein
MTSVLARLVLPFYLRYEHRLDTRSSLIRDWAIHGPLGKWAAELLRAPSVRLCAQLQHLPSHPHLIPISSPSHPHLIPISLSYHPHRIPISSSSYPHHIPISSPSISPSPKSTHAATSPTYHTRLSPSGLHPQPILLPDPIAMLYHRTPRHLRQCRAHLP